MWTSVRTTALLVIVTLVLFGISATHTGRAGTRLRETQATHLIIGDALIAQLGPLGLMGDRKVVCSLQVVKPRLVEVRYPITATAYAIAGMVPVSALIVIFARWSHGDVVEERRRREEARRSWWC